MKPQHRSVLLRGENVIFVLLHSLLTTSSTSCACSVRVPVPGNVARAGGARGGVVPLFAILAQRRRATNALTAKAPEITAAYNIKVRPQFPEQVITQSVVKS